MKILVLSDSHSSLRLMKRCVEAVNPDVLIHLGDYYDDGVSIHELHPKIPIYQVPGNCDRYRFCYDMPEILHERIGGVKFYLTHGHRHQVKSTLLALVRDARKSGADIALYGHTHEADCHREEDGLWVLNPGSCGYGGGSAGLITIENSRIAECRILRETDLT